MVGMLAQYTTPYLLSNLMSFCQWEYHSPGLPRVRKLCRRERKVDAIITEILSVEGLLIFPFCPMIQLDEETEIPVSHLPYQIETS